MALATVLASAALGAGVALWPTLEQRIPVPAVVTLGGTFPSDEHLGSWLESRAALEAGREVLLHHPEGALVASRADLGQTLDTAAALTELGRPRHRPSLLTRLRV